jgi:chaperonin cofactor prefoldin
MSTLYELTGEFRQLLEMIEQGDYTEEELQDTLEGLTGEIEIKADGYAKVIKELEGDSAKIKFEIARLSGKKTFIDNNIKSLKSSLELAMRATGKTKFKTDLFSFNIQKNGGVRALTIVGEVKDLPVEYLVVQPSIPNNEKIRELLKESEVTWAKLEPQGESLRIK